MTMTTLEVRTFLSEIGELRQSLGRVFDRLDKLERMFATHDAEQATETRTRRAWVRWLGTVLAALVPGSILYWLQSKVGKP
jgi:hypothetical protein